MRAVITPDYNEPASFSKKIMPLLNDQLQKAWAHLQSGNTHAALGVIESVLKHAPAHPHALCMLGMARVAAGDAANAVAPLQSALQADPRNGMALDSLGLAFLSLGRFSDAAEVLQRAAAIANAPAVVFMRLGMARFNISRARLSRNPLISASG